MHPSVRDRRPVSSSSDLRLTDDGGGRGEGGRGTNGGPEKARKRQQRHNKEATPALADCRLRPPAPEIQSERVHPHSVQSTISHCATKCGRGPLASAAGWFNLARHSVHARWDLREHALKPRRRSRPALALDKCARQRGQRHPATTAMKRRPNALDLGRACTPQQLSSCTQRRASRGPTWPASDGQSRARRTG